MTGSVRLTNAHRNSILRAALTPVFEKRTQDLLDQEDALGRRCYEAVFSKTIREQAAAMPSEWLRRDDCLRFAVAGMALVFHLKGEGVAVPGRHGGYCNRLGIVTEPTTVEAVRAWQNAKDELEAERARFEGSERLGTRGLRAQMAEAGWRYEAPLIDHPVMPWLIRSIISAAGLWQQRLSVLGFSHSNCGGHCCKGGQTHWKLMLLVFPERYAYVEWREQQIRVVLGDVSMLTDRRKRPGDIKAVKRPLTLTQLRDRVLTAEEAAEVTRCSCLFGDAA